MIQKVEIENYKSLENLSLELGRVNVFIGENGCGKTNILESLVFAAAGLNGSVENIFLTLRGGKATEAKFFRSGFTDSNISDEIRIKIFESPHNDIDLKFNNDNLFFSQWETEIGIRNDFNSLVKEYSKKLDENNELGKNDKSLQLAEFQSKLATDIILAGSAKNKSFLLYNYLIYAPENYFLRNNNIDSPFVEPIGSRGENLLKFIKLVKREFNKEYDEIMHHIQLIDWFESLQLTDDITVDNEIILFDKYLEDGLKSFDIRNANEGFLFVLFYLTVFISDYTPKFFAIDNIDTALNPKLCSKLITILIELAKTHDKQVLITTHNPSVLDGLNLNDDEQRLFVVARNKTGRTRATRIEHKPSVNGTAPVKLSEQFLRGYIGGLPKNF